MSFLLISTDDGGNYDISQNDIALDDSLYTAIFISLFGGNIEASTERERPPVTEQSFDYWGNIYTINDPVKQFNSRTEKALIEVPATSAGILQYEQAARDDLLWLTQKGFASTVIAEAFLIAPSQIELIITIDGDDVFSVIWHETKQIVERVTHE